jgi:hypothetical protein
MTKTVNAKSKYKKTAIADCLLVKLVPHHAEPTLLAVQLEDGSEGAMRLLANIVNRWIGLETEISAVGLNIEIS